MASAAAMLAGVSSTIRIVLSGIWAYSPIVRERLAPLRPLAGGEGGTRRGVSRKPAGLIRGDGRVRWVAPLLGTAGDPHLTPTLSAPRGGRGDIPAACLAVRSVHALALSRGRRYGGPMAFPHTLSLGNDE